MTCYQEFRSLLQKLQYSNHYTQSAAIKDIAARIQEASKNDLEELLEFSILTQNVEVQAKLFSVLAVHLISKGINYEVIVKFDPLYDSIQDLLIKGLPLKAVTAFNLILTLLSCDEVNSRQNLVTHARNMIRVSGCLNTMAEIFSNGLVYQDTWMALCQCLAEACRGSEVNQSYCSHLVPLSVQRCCQGNMDVCQVLQSLLQNHERNIQLLLEYNGLDIFTRKNLQFTMCMQLLNTVVEKSEYAVSVLKTTDVVNHLQDFLAMYGPYSQMGQWAKIILYHLGIQCKLHKNISNMSSVPNTEIRRSPSKNRSRLFNLIGNDQCQNYKYKITEGITPGPIPSYNKTITNHTYIRDMSIKPKYRIPDEHNINPNNTTTLFQNIITEVVNWKSKNEENFKRPQALPRFDREQQKQFQQINQTRNMSVNRLFMKHNAREEVRSSFTFKDLKGHTDMTHVEMFESRSDNYKTTFNISTQDKEIQKSTSDLYTISNFNDTVLDMDNFKPPLVSTPRKSEDSSIKPRTRPEHKPYMKRSVPSPNKAVDKRRSMSTRIFSAINESCTTILKGMKSILFRSKNGESIKLKNKTSAELKVKAGNKSGNYSFTEYMRKRDALLEKDLTSTSSSSNRVNSCKTCKDTILLQNKMVCNDQLKRTVKRLKFGLHLYGCDFKKISKNLWPRDKYMTPEILKHLYRKLIVKEGHDTLEFRPKTHNVVKNKC